MRHLVLQRWAIIFLMVGRLVLGDLAHAMPHAWHESMQPSGTHATQMADCPDHEQDGSLQSPTAPDPGSHDDCCQTKGCKCPCVHASSTAPNLMTLDLSPHESHADLEPIPGQIVPRLTALFRPPA